MGTSANIKIPGIWQEGQKGFRLNSQKFWKAQKIWRPTNKTTWPMLDRELTVTHREQTDLHVRGLGKSSAGVLWSLQWPEVGSRHWEQQQSWGMMCWHESLEGESTISYLHHRPLLIQPRLQTLGPGDGLMSWEHITLLWHWINDLLSCDSAHQARTQFSHS